MVKYLQAANIAIADQTHRTVSDLYYAGDEGGIVCHIVPPKNNKHCLSPSPMFECPVSMALATAVVDYQKHRVKKLKKQRYA